MTTAQIPKLVGARVKRREDPRLITGTATYCDDLKLTGMLYMGLLRSPYGNARVTKLDTSRAKAMRGVVDVVTGAEIKSLTGQVPIGGSLPGQKDTIRWPLAIDRVRHVGEPVAAVLAIDRYVARDAVDAIEVDYEPLPAVADVEKAFAEGAPRVHDEFENNVAYYSPVSTGDVEQAFQATDVTISQRMVEQRLAPVPMETRAVVAQFNKGDGTLTVWNSTQAPHLLRSILSALMNVPEQKVRVIAPEVGGGFGCKVNVYPEDLLASGLSIKTGRPVKWIETRSEAMMATIHGRDHVAYVELAAKSDGTLTGMRIKILAAMGAYEQLFTSMVPTLSGLMVTGCYKIPNVLCEIYGVFTNTTPTAAYRGAGRPEATYYVERAMDILADKLGMDPIELRRKNFPRPEDFPFNTASGLAYDSGDYDKALDRAIEIAGYGALRDKQRAERAGSGKTLTGIGVSTWVEICGMGPSVAIPGGGWEMGAIRVERSGTVTVHTGASPHGQGQETTFAQIVGDELGVPIDSVMVLHGDTAIVTNGVGTFGSRGLAVGGAALVMSIEKVKDKAKRFAAHLMDANIDDLVYENGGVFVQGSPDRSMTLPQIAEAAWGAVNLPPGEEPGLQATSFFEPSNFTFPFGTHIAVVEIDKETGTVKLARYIGVDDCGRIISPLLVAGQLHGGIAQGVAQALSEEVVYDDDGQLITGTLMDYAIPTAEMFPRFELDHTETPTPVNPLGAKGVGEAGTIASTPAVVNAVVDALKHYGVTHIDMMIKPQMLWNLIQQGEEGGPR
ncbi:MAG TPA: xanthine dehydrogenase family protein molybdopterin-binding subunit [Dehalococcoidia bacterium]|nr:xanthine dehydrogenase family protein molybdopterin-binding subunit [Dehalococcoidia bacterium]